MSQAVNWCFTDFDVNAEKQAALLSNTFTKYIVFQHEVSPETGRDHYQGFMWMKMKASLNVMKGRWPGMHFETMKGSHEQAINYCKKEDSRMAGYWEAGLPPAPGKRNDLLEAAQLVMSGEASMKEIAEACPSTFIRYSAGLSRLALHFSKPRDWIMDVQIYHGGTGTGKTRKAHLDNPGAFWKTKSEWWDGYDQHDVVIWDEFAHDVPISSLLRICDSYPLNVAYKGGFYNFVAKRLIFTSNIPFDQWYPDALPEHRAALRRRVTRITHFSGPLGGGGAGIAPGQL
jgi:hypothetical protein